MPGQGGSKVYIVCSNQTRNGKTLLGNGFGGIENDESNVVFRKSETEQ